jgi:DNA ligase (NAD+)
MSQFVRAGVNVIEPVVIAGNGLAGKKFVFTGELEFMARGEASGQVKQKGGAVISTVSKNTDYVVAGKSPGSKYKKAKDLGVKILTEEQFFELISQST